MAPADNTVLLKLLERKNEELATMIEIGKALTATLTIQEVLAEIMNHVGKLLKPKNWSLMLSDEETGELVFEIAVSPVAADLKGFRLNKGEGIAGWVMEHGEPLLIPDVSKDSRFSGTVDAAVSFTTRSIICVPMSFRGKTIGVIELINSFTEATFNDEDLIILSAIADFAAIALQNARNYQKVNDLVITDDLTGLFNAKHFHSVLDAELERAKRYETELSLVFFDLDHFKSVNDTYGHLVGSRTISEVGRLIKKRIRVSDLGARYGGDEYVVVLPNTGPEGALAMAFNLREMIKNHSFLSDDGDIIHVTASFGVATFPRDAANKIDLIKAADAFMYDAKEGGRDGIVTARV